MTVKIKQNSIILLHMYKKKYYSSLSKEAHLTHNKLRDNSSWNFVSSHLAGCRKIASVLFNQRKKIDVEERELK